MPSAAIAFRKYSILCHRWMGVALCVLFAAWFLSGIVLMYCDYPVITDRDRLERAAPIDAARIRLTPEQAYQRIEPADVPTAVTLAMYDGRPAYRFQFGNDSLLVYADNGQLQEAFPADLTLRVASAWTGRPAAEAKFEGVFTAEDQWTVSGEFRRLRPLMKYSWTDGDEIYVSQVTGEVVQHTTRSSRLGAWFGAIPHWLYFTPLRKQASVWSRVVIWASGIGTVASIFGIVVGLTLYSPSRKRYRFPRGRSSVPYAGQKRWHTILGLMFGLVTCTWVFSGMLSMDPFGWDSGAKEERMERTLRGGELRPPRFDARAPQQAVAQASSKLHVKELELGMFAGAPVYVAWESPERSLIIPMEGDPRPLFDSGQIAGLLVDPERPRALAQVRVVDRYEAYYVDRHGRLPLPVLFVRLNDREGSGYYVDLKTARIVRSYVAQSRWNRWLYHGLHSFDLPWLYRNRPVWDILVLTLMLGGSALAVTSLVIGWRRLRTKMRTALS